MLPRKKMRLENEQNEQKEPEKKPALIPEKKDTDDNAAVAVLYEKRTQLEHILLRPDTYIGSINAEEEALWLFNKGIGKMENRTVTQVPGLYKIFDEILVNAADNFQRGDSMTVLKVELDQETATLSVYNNGQSVPVVLHPLYNIYVPQLIFGELLTSSNYNDQEKKTTGGRNGFGAKLANVFSSKFTVEIGDSQRQLTYSQTWSQNMSVKSEPKITPFRQQKKKQQNDNKNDNKNNTSWTRITFRPDLSKFGLTKLDNDFVALVLKRVYDIAGTTSNKLKVYYNQEPIKVSNFEAYVQLYHQSSSPIVVTAETTDAMATTTTTLYMAVNPRWQIAVSLSAHGHYEQVSFVNNIHTKKGGTHVQYITQQLIDAIVDHITKKHKAELSAPVKPQFIKDQLRVFVNAIIENPVFDSQTKIRLTSKREAFGSECLLTGAFLKKLQQSDLMETIVQKTQGLQDKNAKKKTDGKKTRTVLGIEKLDDANWAGDRLLSDQCTLILTEGDSAKALAVSGISILGSDQYGVFPLKGKFLNVREASAEQLLANEEVKNLKQILGLQQGQVYENTKSLRYGKIMIMADQDHDGSHIKGLLLNFFATFWPSLLKMPGFLTEFITPIVKITLLPTSSSSATPLYFYTLRQYEAWKEKNATTAMTIKYYKGLGTSTAAEAKIYFSNLPRHKIDFCFIDQRCIDGLDLAFDKKKADARKVWLQNFTEEEVVAESPPVVVAKSSPAVVMIAQTPATTNLLSYSDFVHKELILFSLESTRRAIPHLLDGLKPGQRKILFACFKRKLKKEIKVAQLAGYVSEIAAYHHGEKSLNDTIVKLAQDYVGSNNVNFLVPSGQFGTRLSGGDDAASSRYIFTYLSPITSFIFRAEDEPLLRYLEDDGISVEPEHYMPILPPVLMNGAFGVATGWSSNVPNYNPLVILEQIRHLLNDRPLLDTDMVPWYDNFRGTIEAVPNTTIAGGKNQQFLCSGCCEISTPTSVRITELPVGVWTSKYKVFLEQLLLNEKISACKPYNTDTRVGFEIFFATPEALDKIRGSLLQFFKLIRIIHTSNMMLFDTRGKITQYATPQEILREFYTARLSFYEKRKIYALGILGEKREQLKQKIRFITEVVSGTLILNVGKTLLLENLSSKGYPFFFPTAAAAATTVATNNSGPRKQQPPVVIAANEKEEAEKEEVDWEEENDEKKCGYDYLLKLPLWSLTLEKIQKLQQEQDRLSDQWNALQKMEIKALWLQELEELEKKLVAHYAHKRYSETSSAQAVEENKKKQLRPVKNCKRKTLS